MEEGNRNSTGRPTESTNLDPKGSSNQDIMVINQLKEIIHIDSFKFLSICPHISLFISDFVILDNCLSAF